jgi:hypothetical protein
MIKSLIYLGVAFVLVFISFYLEKLLERKYYTSEAYGWPVGRFFFIALFSPRKYFKKKNFSKAYIIYLLSIISLCIATYFLFVLLPLSLK